MQKFQKMYNLYMFKIIFDLQLNIEYGLYLFII